MTEEWHSWRRGGLGASDIASAETGLYGGRVGVVADKLGIGTDDIAPALAERGKRWEQPIADAVLATHDLYVIGEQMWAEHPEHTHHRATLEGFLHPGPEATIEELTTLLEVKTRGLHAPYHWDYWITQTQWQMHVSGMARCLLVVATIDDATGQIRRIEFVWVERDQWRIDALVAMADELWAMVQAGELPEPEDGSALPIVKAANATADPSAPVDQAAIDDLKDDIADYAELKERAKAAADRLRLAEAQIRTAMGEATEALTSDGKWRVRVGEPIAKFTRDSEADALGEFPDYGRTVLDRDRFKAERPDDYDRLRRPTADRRLTIKEMSE